MDLSHAATVHEGLLSMPGLLVSSGENQPGPWKSSHTGSGQYSIAA